MRNAYQDLPNLFIHFENYFESWRINSLSPVLSAITASPMAQGKQLSCLDSTVSTNWIILTDEYD